MVEIQEPSDLVVRFEFERAGYVLPEASRFMGRDVDFGLTVFNYTPLTAKDIEARVRCHPRRLRELGPGSWQDELIGAKETDCFRVTKSHLAGAVTKEENSAVIAIITAGDVAIEVGGERHELKCYEKFFLPAGIGPVKFTPRGGACDILECRPPS
jgi:mannose-6-phosphate isomerase